MAAASTKIGRRGRRPATPRPTLRREVGERAVELVDAIVEASALILAEHGYDGLTTNRVAERAGVSIGTLYRYFPNKEAIVSALFDRYLARIRAIVGPAIDLGTSIDDILQRLQVGFLGTTPADQAVFRSLWTLRTAADAHERIAAQNEEFVVRATAAIERLGIMRGDDARALAFVVIHAGDGLVNAISQTPTVNIAALARTFLDLVRTFVVHAQSTATRTS